VGKRPRDPFTACPYTNPASSLDWWRYDVLHRDGKHLIDSWFMRAYERAGCADKESFEPFIFCWIAFNAWASCVTQEDSDRAMVRKVANCPDMRDTFLNLYAQNTSFRSAVDSFAALWPIFKAQELRRHGYVNTAGKTRNQIIENYLELEGISFSPECWRYHKEKRGEAVPADWPHTIETIYRVRCNLFHGEKSPHSEMDADIVKAAFDVLVTFLAAGDIISLEQRRSRVERREEEEEEES
jgi:hypothetical protein